MSPIGFQQGAFENGAFQTGVAVAPAQFGYAIVISESQTGIQAARQVYLEYSACFITASYFDANRNPFAPNAVSYGVWDVTSGFNIVPWTALTPAASNQVTVTSAQNVLISFSRPFEAHQVVFRIVDGFGDTNYARVIYDLKRVPFVPVVNPSGFQTGTAFQGGGAFQ
jgi:hypothetical protein